MIDKLKERIKEIKNIKEKKLKFIIKGEPLYSLRPRKGMFGNFYVPNAAKNNKFIKNKIKKKLDQYKLKDLIYTDLSIKIIVYFPIPNSFNKIDKELAELKLIRPSKKPDVDNITKTYLDALNNYIYHDDSQVVNLICKKYFSKKPRIVIIIKYKEDFTSNFYKNRSKKLKKK